MLWLIGAAVFIIINVFTFVLWGADKKAAASDGAQMRVSEFTLLMLAVFGGSTGAVIGQQYFRHKTRKQPFKSVLYFIVGIQIVVVYALCYRPTREALFAAMR
jgi:uncharacterized membrane protein YsdA (DUF1294 family)